MVKVSPNMRQSQRHYASRRLLTHPSRRAVSRLVLKGTPKNSKDLHYNE